ncbi:type III secretion protein EpaO [Escherichia coli]|nr:type III secretion protein EpaO [Escherichia coli]
MALMPETERLIVEWLSLSSTPLNLKYPELKYNRLCFGKVFDGVFLFLIPISETKRQKAISDDLLLF